MRGISSVLGISESKSIFGFRKKSTDFILKKQEVFENFLTGLKNINSMNEQDVRALLNEYLIMTNTHLKLYKNVYENLWETYKYLNELPIIKYDIGHDEFTSPLEKQFLLGMDAFSKDAMNYVVKIKGILRYLLGANNSQEVLAILIANLSKQKVYLEDLLHPDKSADFIRLDEEELELVKMFNVEKKIISRVTSKISELNSLTERFVIGFEDKIKFINVSFVRLKNSYNENLGVKNKALALSHYANEHAGIIAFSVVSLSAAMFLGPYMGVAQSTIQKIGSIFHIVATYGEGIQSIEEGNSLIAGVKNWIKNIGDKRLTDEELLLSI